ncbi:uncharacterized protein LOC130052371 [Ostrea edulis]|uniref:uncharacterized protein LOC130052371 n=1 Tax=Ostrea edulis TaxID=37623 RepID=UPI0024AF22EE|nr:uncharacterized protein LOC130052371 [Ostrea edulis]
MFRLLFLSLLPFVSGEYISGHRLDALNLQTFKDIGARSCCKECAAHGGCHSVNYNVQTFSCELTYHVAELKAKTANADYIYMDKSYCDSLVASCSNFCNLTCTTNQKCVLLNTNQPMCIATGCDHPSSIPGITPRDVGMNIGSVYWFDCTTPTPSKQKFTCDASGQWIPTFSECRECLVSS